MDSMESNLSLNQAFECLKTSTPQQNLYLLSAYTESSKATTYLKTFYIIRSNLNIIASKQGVLEQSSKFCFRYLLSVPTEIFRPARISCVDQTLYSVYINGLACTRLGHPEEIWTFKWFPDEITEIQGLAWVND